MSNNNSKRKICLALTCLSIICSPISMSPDMFPHENIVLAESLDTSDNDSNNTVEVNTTNYKLINDLSKKLNADKLVETSTELDSIFKESKFETGGQFKIYTFIYNDATKSLSDAEQDVLSHNKLDSSIKPIIFILNSNNNKYKYIIDERISPFVSKAYLDSMVKNVLLSNDSVSEESLNEFLIRISTINMININRNIKVSQDIDKDIDKSHFNIHSFNNDENNPDSNKITSYSTNPDNKMTKEKETYTLISLLLALATVGVVFFIRKKKFTRK